MQESSTCRQSEYMRACGTESRKDRLMEANQTLFSRGATRDERNRKAGLAGMTPMWMAAKAAGKQPSTR